MYNTAIGLSVRRGLLKRGFDRHYVNRIARELDEHWLDLVREGLRQGLSEREAESSATESMGTAEPLIEEFAARMQRSSWLGRHPTPGFALLALGMALFWWALLMALIGSAAGLVAWETGRTLANVLSNDARLACIDGIRWTSYFVPAWLICHIARRRHCGWKAALWGCLVLGMHNGLHSFVYSGTEPGHGTLSWGYTFNLAHGPALLPLFAPTLVLGMDLLWNRRPEPRAECAKNP